MTEFFIFSNSFAAPFFSDSHTGYQHGESAVDALEQYAATYQHPAGLYAAMAYESADAYHKGAKPLATWLCNHERERQRLTADLHSYSYLGNGPGDFELNGERHLVADPKAGAVVAA